MSKSDLKLLPGNAVGYNALNDYLSEKIESTEGVLKDLALAALFSRGPESLEQKDKALTERGKVLAYRELLDMLSKLASTKEGKK